MWFKVHVTNHTVYQNLVYRNELFLKKVLQAFPRSHRYPTPSLLLLLLFFSLTSFCSFPTIWTPVTGCGKLDLLTIFPQGGNVTDISNSMFPSSLQNMETRYFVLWFKISVLPWFSKILEKFMYKRGIKFLDKHNIIGGSLRSSWR